MITEINFENASETKTWDEFVSSHPDASPFHLSNWLRTIQQTYPFELHAYAHCDGSHIITAIFPYFLVKGLSGRFRSVSLPFSDYGGPLCRDESQENQFLELVMSNNQKKQKNIEIRGQLFKQTFFICNNYYKRHILLLSPNPQDVRNVIDKRTIQYSIRKAERAGIKIIEENTLEGMHEFYRLHLMTRKKHGVPCPPFSFFKNMFDNMISKDIAFLLLATSESRPIAAGMFIKFNKGIYYKYNASDPECLSGQTPNHLLTWSAIEKGCLGGYSYFDFGRTSPDNHGLMRYKEMWGAKAIDLPYHYYPQIAGAASKEENDRTYQIITKIWRSLPDPFVDKIGPVIYKYLV